MAKKKQVGGKRPGAGRPVGPDGPSTVLTVSVPQVLADGLNERAQAEGWSRSKAVAEAIRGLLRRKSRR